MSKISNTDLIKIIHDDVKQIKEDMVAVKITNGVQNQQLTEHMRRTRIVEARLDKIDLLKWGSAIGMGIAVVYLKSKGLI